MCSTTIDDYRWLVGDEAVSLLIELAVDDRDVLAATERLRRQVTAERAHLVLDQIQLRKRAAGKFAAADRMFFTRRGLEQASSEFVARYKAMRFSGLATVADLCCGIGGDLAALAARGGDDVATKVTTGVDADPVMTLLAAANCRAYDQHVDLHDADVASRDVRSVDAWHIDPDRRDRDRRRTVIASYRPDLVALRNLLAENECAAVKLAPAAEAPEDWQAAAELEWISHRRECRQQVAWFGDLAGSHDDGRAGLRRATWLGDQPQQHQSLVGHADEFVEVAGQIGRFVYDPDPAILAARLSGSVAAQFGLSGIAAGVAYLTSDHSCGGRLLPGFEVTDVLPFDVRRLKRLLKSRRIGRLEVKKRGISEDPAVIARRLRVPGERPATLLLAPVAGNVTAILARRLPHDDASYADAD